MFENKQEELVPISKEEFNQIFKEQITPTWFKQECRQKAKTEKSFWVKQKMIKVNENKYCASGKYAQPPNHTNLPK